MTSYISKLKLLGKEIYLFNKYRMGKSSNFNVLVDSCYLLNNKIVMVIKNGITQKYEIIQRDVNQNIIDIVLYKRACSIDYYSLNSVQCIDLNFTPNTVNDTITKIFSFSNGRIMHVSGYDNFSFAVFNTKEIGKVLYITYIVKMQKVRLFVRENLDIFDITNNKDDKTIVLDDANSSVFYIRPTENKYRNIGFANTIGDV